MFKAQISYVARLVDGESRIEKDCYEGEEVWQVVESVYRAVMLNTGMEILEIHISRKESV